MNQQAERDYTSTLLRMAGNIAAGLVTSPHIRFEGAGAKDENERRKAIAVSSVDLAEKILAEVLTRQSKEEPT